MKTNQVYFHTSEDMHEVDDKSTRLVCMSPPYTNNPDGQNLDKEDYRAFLQRICREIHRVLIPGGVMMSLNTDLRDHAEYNKGNRSFEGTVWFKHNDVRRAAEESGMRMFDDKIWIKTLKRDLYRYSHSHMLFFEKNGGKRFRHHPARNVEEFDPSVWLLQDSCRRYLGDFIFRDAIHPDIPRRCIRELTKEGELVVSPFTGSGTILAAAEELDRPWIGYEINTKLRPLIQHTLQQVHQSK